MQANWELLVADFLADKSIILRPYGDGADIGAASSSRVTFPDLLESHHITVLQNKKAELDLLNNQFIDYTKGELIFDRFVATRNDGWYYEEHPFDKILCLQNDKEIIVPFKGAKFALTAKLKQSRLQKIFQQITNYTDVGSPSPSEKHWGLYLNGSSLGKP